MPERHLCYNAKCGLDLHGVLGDPANTPGGGTQSENLTNAGFIHHFLIELANPSSALVPRANDNTVEPAVGNGASIGDRQSLCTWPRCQRIGRTVPVDTRPK